MDCVQQYRNWEKSHRAWFQQYIVGISAHADGDDGDRGIRVGMDRFIPKPLPLKLLRELVDSEEILEVSNRLDVLNEDAIAVPYFLLVNQKVDIPPNESATSSISDNFEGTGPVCLLVEDSVSVNKVMMRCIERQGWQSYLANDGEEGLRLLKTRNWDAVFMDDQLPLLSGSACVKNFREWEAENRVCRQQNLYFCSENCTPNMKPPSGFDGAVGKPFTQSLLASILERANGDKASLI